MLGLQRLGSELDGHRALEGLQVGHPLRVLRRAAGGAADHVRVAARGRDQRVDGDFAGFPAGRMQQSVVLPSQYPPSTPSFARNCSTTVSFHEAMFTTLPPATTRARPQLWMPRQLQADGDQQDAAAGRNEVAGGLSVQRESKRQEVSMAAK